MAIPVEKWLVMGALALLSAILGVLPYFLLKRVKSLSGIANHNTYHLTITMLACTGAGVLLATTLVHMLPENRAGLESNPYVQENFDSHLPLAEILTLIGLVIIYFLEEVAGFIMRSGWSSGFSHGHSHESHVKTHQTSSEVRRRRRSVAAAQRRASILSIHSASRTSVEFHMDPTPPSTPEGSSNSKADLHPHSISLSIEEDAEEPTVSHVGSILALIALSFHAIMEGIAVGVQSSMSLWLMFGAVASHKFLISFCMGMELVAAKASAKIFIGSIALFAFLSPIGIFIGSYLTSDSSTHSMPVNILSGFASGTLLYVVFFEILSRERERKESVLENLKHTGFLQLAGLVVGMIAMVSLITLTDHGHGDEEHTH